MRFFGQDHHRSSAPFEGAHPSIVELYYLMLKVLGFLDKNVTNLSDKDQRKVNEIYEISSSIVTRIDVAMRPAVPGGPRRLK